MAEKDRRSAEKRQGRSPEHNNPVPLETFDRERMGIAAKE